MKTATFIPTVTPVAVRSLRQQHRHGAVDGRPVTCPTCSTVETITVDFVDEVVDETRRVTMTREQAEKLHAQLGALLNR